MYGMPHLYTQTNIVEKRNINVNKKKLYKQIKYFMKNLAAFIGFV